MSRFLQRLALLTVLVVPLSSALAGATLTDDSLPASNYIPASGDSFFLLADNSFTSNEIAKVRLETPGRYGMEQYDGVDVRVYRIPHPIDFLKKQKNLHRVAMDGDFRGEGLSNTLSFLWSNWYGRSRRIMQRTFSFDARKQVTKVLPELKVGEALTAPPHFDAQIQFAPLKTIPLVSEFRYPIWVAKPIQVPAGVNLEGSSSNFSHASAGNIYLPLGKLQPGLYLVEAMVGKYRATTMVFVSNTVGMSKISGNELMVWAANKDTGKPVADTKVFWSDGLGILASGSTSDDGILRLSHISPERSYVLGSDSEGGVFVAENLYYASEIYNTKLYVFTDRPLYRPGDWVHVKMLGREFNNGGVGSSAAASAPALVSVVDANGMTLQTLNLKLDGQTGASGRFQLPENSVAGGYELRVNYQDQIYNSAFRVVSYIKPHFEISLQTDKKTYHTEEPITGYLSLLYPDGKPVVNAKLELSLRSQQLSMVGNDLQYQGKFPVKLSATHAISDEHGQVALSLPMVSKPSRYLLTVFASDGAAYRVKITKEILIEQGAAHYVVSPVEQFGQVGEAAVFLYHSDQPTKLKPAYYETIRLEDRHVEKVRLPQDTSDGFSITFNQPGTYTVTLKSDDELILGATSYSVSGEGIHSAIGTVQLVTDKTEYHTGDIAQVLITFPEPVKDALLTLERERVEENALLSSGAVWLDIKRLSDTQYRAEIPVKPSFAPNLTFSVLYTRNGQYSFQNVGIKVAAPRVDISIHSDKEVYQPGDKVTLDLTTTVEGKPVAANLSMGVVDEMIYALQPEIAPSISEFFNHLRRNNVRTSSSLSFISYDLALPGEPSAPGKNNRSDRSVKVLERPRREDVDTAVWLPNLVTDASGKAHISFRMPDSLTRWRITARAVSAQGIVGQKRQEIRSEKDVYLKWSGPVLFRQGDKPKLGVFVFNQSGKAHDAEMLLTYPGGELRQKLHLNKGPNYVALPQGRVQTGDWQFAVLQEEQIKDQMTIAMNVTSDGWMAHQKQNIVLNAGVNSLTLPATVRKLRLYPDNNARAIFSHALGDVLDESYSSVVDTASRLLPLSLSYKDLGKSDAWLTERLRQTLQNNRQRLIQMAGPNARFTWWGGDEDANAFLTAYAYYADWYAAQALGVELPADHWQHALDMYGEQADDMPALQRALVLMFAKEEKQPITSLLQGLKSKLDQEKPTASSNEEGCGCCDNDSLILLNPDSELGNAVARVLTDYLLRQNGSPAMEPEKLQQSEELIRRSNRLFAQAVMMMVTQNSSDQATELLRQLSPAQPSIERALSLAWLYHSVDKTAELPLLSPENGWVVHRGKAGGRYWQWAGQTLPETISLPEDLPHPISASLSFDQPMLAQATNAAPESKNDEKRDIAIRHRLLKMVPSDEAFNFSLEEVTNGDVLSDSLYLDEVTLSLKDYAQPQHYGLVEVPLPPGADVEQTTWEINVGNAGDKSFKPLEKSRAETGEMSYRIPVSSLYGTVVYRHLIRFSQKGTFHLPATRYSNAYAPQDAIFADDATMKTLKVH